MVTNVSEGLIASIFRVKLVVTTCNTITQKATTNNIRKLIQLNVNLLLSFRPEEDFNCNFKLYLKQNRNAHHCTHSLLITSVYSPGSRISNMAHSSGPSEGR